MNVANLSNFQAGGESSCVPSSLFVHVFHILGLSKLRLTDIKYFWRFTAKKKIPFRYRMLSCQAAIIKDPAVIFSRPKGFNVFMCRNGNGGKKRYKVQICLMARCDQERSSSSQRRSNIGTPDVSIQALSSPASEKMSGRAPKFISREKNLEIKAPLL